MNKTPLCIIAEKHRSDKCPAIYHSYTPFYHELLKDRIIRRVLEIGIGNIRLMGGIKDYKPGASLFMWEEYLPDAEVFGVDIDPLVLINRNRIWTYECDSRSPESAKKVLDAIGGKFDLIIDDGSHLAEDQLATIQNFVPSLATNGIYIIEDIMDPLHLWTKLPWPSITKLFHPAKRYDRIVVIKGEWLR